MAAMDAIEHADSHDGWVVRVQPGKFVQYGHTGPIVALVGVPQRSWRILARRSEEGQRQCELPR